MKTLSVVIVALAFCVVVFGAFVRLSDAGLSCPDWPGCYGSMVVPHEQAGLYPDRPLERGKAWIEMGHRYLAGILGLLIAALAVVAWRNTEKKFPASFLLLLVVAQALLGMWTVTLLLKPAIVTSHLLGGMATLALACWIALSTRSRDVLWARSVLRNAAFAGVVLLFAQIALGGWVSAHYAGLACDDFPLCDGAVFPAMDFVGAFSLEWRQSSEETMNAIQWTHRVGALVVLVYLTWLAVNAMAYEPLFAALTLLLVCAQVALGIANVLLGLPLPLAVAHNAVAALLLISLVMLNFRLRRHPATPSRRQE
jgi:cytochrome c oxidase assembly protein subunit 15